MTKLNALMGKIMNKNLIIFNTMMAELRALDYSVKRICEIGAIDTQRYYSLNNSESNFYKKEITDRELGVFIKNIKSLERKLSSIYVRAEKKILKVK